MYILKRTLSIINSLLLILISFVAMIYFVSTSFELWLSNYLSIKILPYFWPRFWCIFACWLLFVLALFTLTILLKRTGGYRGVTRLNDIGEFKVSIHAIENIAMAETRRISGLKVMKTLVNKVDNGVCVVVKASAMMDENIPELSKTVQDRVKTAIEKSTEISVKEVKVLIADIFIPNKPRVE